MCVCVCGGGGGGAREVDIMEYTMPNSSQHFLTMTSPTLRFTEILLNFNESNIQSRHNKNTSSSIIQKNTNTGSHIIVLEKKDKHRIKDVPYVKDGTPVFDEVATEHVAKKRRNS